MKNKYKYLRSGTADTKMSRWVHPTLFIYRNYCVIRYTPFSNLPKKNKQRKKKKKIGIVRGSIL